MDSLKIKQILKRYLEGKGSNAEMNTVDNWYSVLDNEPPVNLEGLKEEQLREEMWQAIKPALKQPATVKQLNYGWLKIAAAILVFCTAGIYLWKGNTQQQHLVADSSFTTITTRPGERKLVTLPDSTELTLNGGSSIRIQNDFSHQRQVDITDGEVYFDVKHNSKRPFIIKSGVLTTHVLGTAFNIRAYKLLKKIAVGVTHGKVGIVAAGKPTQFLIKGQQLIFNKEKETYSLSALDAQMLTWQQGKVIFNDASFDEMALLMNKNYGVHVTAVASGIKSKRFTATLNTSMSSVKALEVIAAIHQFKIKQRRDTVEIYR